MMISSKKNLKIISIIMTSLALFTLFLPWVKASGMIQQSMKQYIKKGGMSPLDLCSVFSKICSTMDAFGGESSYGSFTTGLESIQWFMLLYKVVTIVAVIAGIYTIIYAINRKQLLKGFDDFAFPVSMGFLCILTIGMVLVWNSEIESVEQGLSTFSLGFVNLDMSMHITLWMIIGVILSFPFKMWEKLLAKSTAGQKAIVKIDKASSKIGDMIDKGSEKIQSYTDVWVCPNCGARVSGDAQYCSKCGMKKPEIKTNMEQNESESEHKRPEFCPFCGRKLGVNDRFCQKCGVDINELGQVLIVV